MLKNRPKRSSLKQSCSQGRKVGRTDHQAKTSIGEVSSDEEELISDFQLISNVFHNRRKSCNSWRGRQRERAKGGSVSSESEVFEIIHMEENNDEEAEVTSLDKFITGTRCENNTRLIICLNIFCFRPADICHHSCCLLSILVSKYSNTDQFVMRTSQPCYYCQIKYTSGKYFMMRSIQSDV